MATERTPQRFETEAQLERAALSYLKRFAGPSSNLERALRKKVRRSAEAHGTDAQAGMQAVSAILTRLSAAGVLDDRRWARDKARALHGRGHPERVIRQRLRLKRVAPDFIDEAIAALDDEQDGEPELAAAVARARRRRLGPWRHDPEERKERRQKDLAAMARAGFSFELARRVVDAESPEALDDLVHGDTPPGWGRR